MRAAWPVDAAGSRERREQWRVVKAELDAADYFTAKEVAQLREYFVSGEVAREYVFANYSGPLPFAFAAWFHPALTDKTWAELLKKALSPNLRFTQEVVNVFAGSPPPTFDPIAPRFCELVYLQSAGPVGAPFKRGGATELVPPVRISPAGVLREFQRWTEQSKPCEHPRCRYLIETVASIEADSLQKMYDAKFASERKFVKRWLALCEKPRDPRCETARKLLAMTQSLDNLRPLREFIEQSTLIDQGKSAR